MLALHKIDVAFQCSLYAFFSEKSFPNARACWTPPRTALSSDGVEEEWLLHPRPWKVRHFLTFVRKRYDIFFSTVIATHAMSLHANYCGWKLIRPNKPVPNLSGTKSARLTTN